MDIKTNQYSRPRPPKPPEPVADEEIQPEEVPQDAKLRLRDIARNFMGGMGQGLGGSERTREQWLRSKSPSRRYSPKSWLPRVLKTKPFK